MHLYREVRTEEIEKEIELEYTNSLISDKEDRNRIEIIILNSSRKQAIREIDKYLKGRYISYDFYPRVKKLYRALNEIKEGRKIYTEL